MIPIIFQNSEFVVVEKPPGLAVHNDENNLLTLMSEQLGFREQNKPDNKQHSKTLFPVHRLDKETSGVQILALNQLSAQKLALEFQQKTIKKIYIGICRGAFEFENGIWQQALTDKAEGRKNPAGLSKDRVPCETQYKVLTKNNYLSLCEFSLITGRQHQIRKHCAISGHALVGDPRYNDDKYNQRMSEIYKTTRMFLHCFKVEILGQRFISKIPEDFAKLLPYDSISE